MKIFLAGATGFVGSALIPRLLQENHQLLVLVRHPDKADRLPAPVKVVAGDPTRPGRWQEEAASAEVIINLTGASVFTRWTAKAKQQIMDSRVNSTRHIVEAMQGAANPMTLINTSAAGYYGIHDDQPKTETSPPGQDFLAQVCRAWESEALKAADHGHRVAIARLAVVLGRGGGALAQMIPPFNLGLGGRLGSGKQPFPWIHLDDLTAIFAFLCHHREISGPVNCGAPQIINNAEFTKAMGQRLKRPTLLAVPGFMLRLALGEMSAALLGGTRMVPEVLERHGFVFRFPEIDQALADLLP
ncbi:TIGR01777 family oxidoreductase [Desulfurivibrio alkaliphilus]|uniref:TIGR01777 family protein n=1 Tax=Desulfurivibrio alkaliphilus (strain DSM 19089 / UNIQEM U267 / AHT2) TaxID=589865 RepID=D6Z261_DESAT|nr:TIGR01777 family oxidoreductase [Desulfurivibrio alkaliphilus]ADH85636.1 domain of unknown function DUF1731 [Desulfurivibrio alkaliphilus AHT 2]